MRLFVTIACFFIAGALHAQADSLALIDAVAKLDKALVSRDEATLGLLLDKKLTFGHSNGWVQTKDDIRKDFSSGKLLYRKMESSGHSVEMVGKEWATVRMQTLAAGTANGNDFDMKLHVLQVWKFEKKGWQLIARQSVKLEK